MVDVLEDIDVIENALIAFQEGASDEKYAAYHALTVLLLKKKDMVAEFEATAPVEYS